VLLTFAILLTEMGAFLFGTNPELT
jgi:hypothetical protein